MTDPRHNAYSAEHALRADPPGGVPCRVPTQPPIPLPADRLQLTRIGMLAVLAACTVFTVSRLGTQIMTGLATPWWGNAIGVVAMLGVWLWFRGDPRGRTGPAANLTGATALVALLPPVAYGMSSTLWWVALVGFAMVLMASRFEGLVWMVVVVAAIALGTALEPAIQIEGAIGEQTLERLLARVVFAVLLMGIAFGFRLEVERRAAELAEASAAKSRFLGHVGHELRNPLHSVIAMTDLALHNDLRPEARTQIRTARSSANLLLLLLNDVLQAARSEEDSLPMASTPFDLHQVVADVVRPYAYQARDSGITLSAGASAGVPARRVGDAGRISQILMNLLGNAMKHAGTGSIDVQLSGDGPHVVVCVSDTGPGIPSASRERIFEPFERLDHRTRGIGLGLPISRGLARRMGGDLEYRERTGGGSEFELTLRLPIESPAPGPQSLLDFEDVLPDDPTTEAGPLDVLVVEDDPTNRLILATMLKRLGHRALTADDGVDGLEKWRDNQVDVIITDVQMPRLDGLGLLKAVRAESDVPVVLCTAAGVAPDAFDDTGALALLAKPFTLDDVAAILNPLIE